jgi:4-hydroxysphinganine ceramide fatty acyl 2-hydroxylase
MSHDYFLPKRSILDNQISEKLMESSFLNKLTKTNVFAVYTVYFMIIVYFFIQSIRIHTWSYLLFGVITGSFLWTLAEYLIHRFSFHWKPRNKLESIMVFIFHDVHHLNPKDASRSITPLMFSLPLIVLVYFVFKFIFGNYALSVYPGFLLGYLIYSMIHDSTHHFPMNFFIGKQLKRHHMRHHYFDNNKNFGVSSPIWDYVFKTYAHHSDHSGK